MSTTYTGSDSTRETYELTFDVEDKDVKPTRTDKAPQTAVELEMEVIEEAAGPGFAARILQHMELSTVLRVFGAGVVVTAIGVFLFQHWEAGNDMFRYSLLFGQTVALSLLGFATSKFLKEPKSARVFLTLGLVSSAASFTILGALLYSTVQWDAVSVAYPGFAYWRLDSASEALTWIAGSLVLLAPLSFIGYLTLARPVAKTLTGLFIFNGILVMLPIRDPAVASTMAAAGGIFSFMVLARLRKETAALRTLEGVLARVIAIAPIGIIAGRCGYIYAASAVSVASLGLLAYATLRQMAVIINGQKAWQRTFEILSVLPALVTGFAIAELVDDLVPARWDDELAFAALCAVTVLALVDLARRSGHDGLVYARGAALVTLLAGITELVISPSMGTALFCAIVSAGVAVYTRSAGFAYLYRASLLSLLAGVGYHVYFAIEAFDLGGWMGLAVLGIVAIVAAAAIERHGERLKVMVMSAVRIPAAE